MANPNIVNVASILGNTASRVATTANALLINNPASSNKVYKINTLLCSNFSTSNTANITIHVFPEDDIGGTANAIASKVLVPVNATLVVIDKSTSFYLLEDKSIGIQSGANSTITVTASWEEIS